jgi:hypothetical protein
MEKTSINLIDSNYRSFALFSLEKRKKTGFVFSDITIKHNPPPVDILFQFTYIFSCFNIFMMTKVYYYLVL